MKKLFFLSVFILSFIFSSAQDKSYIEVSSTVGYDKEIESYKLDLILGQDLYYTDYYYDDKPTLEEMKAAFFKKVKEVGLKESDFKEDVGAYIKYQYTGAGTCFVYETKDEQNLTKINELKSLRGLNIATTRVQYAKEIDEERLFSQAFDLAKEKAEKMAKKIGRKLGKAYQISDFNSDYITSEETLYYMNYDSSYRINVRFELE